MVVGGFNQKETETMTTFTRRSSVSGKEHTLDVPISPEQEQAFMRGEETPSSLGLSEEQAVFLLTGATAAEMAAVDQVIAMRRSIAAAQRSRFQRQ
jgi:hypothetical protein